MNFYRSIGSNKSNWQETKKWRDHCKHHSKLCTCRYPLGCEINGIWRLQLACCRVSQLQLLGESSEDSSWISDSEIHGEWSL